MPTKFVKHSMLEEPYLGPDPMMSHAPMRGEYLTWVEDFMRQFAEDNVMTMRFQQWNSSP
ncbi:MAG: hypothetical protein ACXABY_33255 [Candidatus Thorarchaeota archaeon]|jgi:hypothetical protein